MHRRFGVLLAFTAVAMGTMALAAEEILLNGKAIKTKGVIASESAREIALKSGDKFAAEDIDDIIYELGPNSTAQTTIAYSSAFNQERIWLKETDAKKRATAYNLSLDSYEKAASQVAEKRVKAHLDFKIGYMRGKKAQEDNTDPKNAIVRLRDFVTKNPNSWETGRALALLAKLQVDSKDYVGADLTFNEILKSSVSDDLKNDAKLQGARILNLLGKPKIAAERLAELAKTTPKGSKAYGQILVAQADCLIADNKAPEAVELLKQAIKESDDKALRATAYNTLGVNLYKAEQLKEARWEFLWVDVVYYQDKNEHARALYYLSHIFDKLADPDKAAQCRTTLLDPGYAGTDYQRKLQAEQKK